MTERPDILNLNEPYPDVVIDRLRRAVKEQIDELGGQVQRTNDALLLLQATADFAQSTLNTVKGARTQLATITGRLDALTAGVTPMQTTVGSLVARVQALEEAAVAPRPSEEPST